MELVYLWVEDYKNIKKQGFNFSPRFECDFKDNELTITEKENYVSIFPDNINITAIVGENGSGKSSIINSILDSTHNINYSPRSKCKLYNSEKKIVEKEELINELYSIYFDFSLGDTIKNKQDENYKKYYSLEPSRNYLSLGPGAYSKIENQSFDSIMYSAAMFFYHNTNEKIWQELKIPYYQSLHYYQETGVGNKRQQLALQNIYKLKYPEEYNEQENILNAETITREQLVILKNKLYSIVINIRSLEDFFHQVGDIYEDILTLYKFKLFLTDDIEFKNLSKGQQTFISYMGVLYRLQNKFKDFTSINLIIDELESTLHPQWQKKFLNLLLSFIKTSSIFNDKNLNIILSTHSPFILSDLPKENIIFLKDGKQEKAFEHKQTFGANIHTLLSDGFFMGDGLMGEYAKKKINDVIKYLKNEESIIQSDEEAKNIIDIIGEPILQNTLMTMYDEKIYSNESKLDKLKRKKLQLEEEIKELEENPSEES